MAGYTGMTVAEILRLKKARIRKAPVEAGSPSWDDIMPLTWEEIVRGVGGGTKKLIHRFAPAAKREAMNPVHRKDRLRYARSDESSPS
ncbi:MAG: hypothetical protein ACK4RK_13325 [Gemmataceae bacterium]